MGRISLYVKTIMTQNFHCKQASPTFAYSTKALHCIAPHRQIQRQLSFKTSMNPQYWYVVVGYYCCPTTVKRHTFTQRSLSPFSRISRKRVRLVLLHYLFPKTDNFLHGKNTASLTHKCNKCLEFLPKLYLVHVNCESA